MYAIVDIETTGGYADNNAITEVAIVLHDGNGAVKRYETLIHPRQNHSPVCAGAHRHYR